MSGWLAYALAVALVGGLLDAPGLILVAAITAVYGTLTRLWTRYGMERVEYTRTLGSSRAVVGDDVVLDVTIWNRKPLPLPWVAADDLVTDTISIREQQTLDREAERHARRILRNAWSLAWYERVVRHFHVDAERRGTYEMGPVRLRVRDILGRDAAEAELDLPATLLVAPRILPVAGTGRDAWPIGDRRASQSLFHDPALFGGVRPFSPGDSVRHIHWPATARLGKPVSRRYEPARGREVLLALDVQTVEGPHWQMTYDDDVFEALCVIAASLGRRLLADGTACGIAAASFSGTTQRTAYLAPSASRAQGGRIGDLLARIGPVSSQPFQSLLTEIAHRLPPGASVIAVTGRDPRSWLPVLRRLGRSGYDVALLTVGEGAGLSAAAARNGGVRAAVAAVSPNWSEANAVDVAR